MGKAWGNHPAIFSKNVCQFINYKGKCGESLSPTLEKERGIKKNI